MAISSTTNRVTYVGNGVTTAFGVSFPFHAQADLVVIETIIATGVQTTKLLTTHYTISGTTDALGHFPNGGNVNALLAPSSTVTWTIYRDPTLTQSVDLVEGDPLPVESAVESPLDRLTMISQRNRDLISRTLRQPDGDSANILQLPAKIVRISKYLGFDAAGNPVALPTANGNAFTFNPLLPQFTKANLLLETPTVGRLAGVTDDVRGPWMAQGSQWFSLVGEVVNVKEFGAKGDDTTDDSTAIQSALNLTPLGKTIYFPPGIYRIASTLTVKSYTRLVGAGSGGNTSGVFTTNNASAIRYVGTTGAINFQDQTTDTDKIVMQSGIEDMAIIGNGSTSGYGILIQNPASVDLNRVFIANHGTIGVDIEGGAFASSWGQNTYIRNSWVTHNRTGNIRVGGAYRPTITNIENNSILAGGKYLIYVSNGWITNIVHNELASLAFNQVIGGSGTGVQGHGVVIDVATVVNIEGNSFESISGQVGTPVKYIITGFNGDTQANTTAAAQGVSIMWNSFNPGQPDVDLIHARKVRGLTIEGNFIQDGVAGGTNRAFVLEDQEEPWPVSDLEKNYFFTVNNITPITVINPYTEARLITPTYGTTVAINTNNAAAAGKTHQFQIVVTDGVAFTISNPIGFGWGAHITIIVKNTSGGAMGAVTWDTLYKLAAWTNPATATSRSISFRFDPNGNWYEISRTTVDVPN